jgi:hypothetical protein
MDSRTLTTEQAAARDAALANQVPAKLWLLLTGALERKCAAGTAWVKAGRPRDCALYADFCEAEKEFESYDRRAQWMPRSKEQRDEWTAIHRRFDP